MTTQLFELGNIYRRKNDIHGQYRGEGRESGGIMTLREDPYIFLFTGESDAELGFKDGWNEQGVFLYAGEGRTGDMDFVGGNLAVRDHVRNGKDLLLFERVAQERDRYLGMFTCPSWEYREAPDAQGQVRKAIVFHLVPAATGTAELESGPLSDEVTRLRTLAYGAAAPAVEATAVETRRAYSERSRALRSYVLARADGVCESCTHPAPFSRPDGTYYLEPHHTRRVSDGGPDHPRWVGAICPNCHREIHYGSAGPALNVALENYLGIVERDPPGE